MLKVSVSKVAELMCKGPQFVRVALQRNLVPFGFAVKINEQGNRYNYYINPSKLAEYLGITETELEEAVKG